MKQEQHSAAGAASTKRRRDSNQQQQQNKRRQAGNSAEAVAQESDHEQQSQQHLAEKHQLKTAKTLKDGWQKRPEYNVEGGEQLAMQDAYGWFVRAASTNWPVALEELYQCVEQHWRLLFQGEESKARHVQRDCLERMYKSSRGDKESTAPAAPAAAGGDGNLEAANAAYRIAQFYREHGTLLLLQEPAAATTDALIRQQVYQWLMKAPDLLKAQQELLQLARLFGEEFYGDEKKAIVGVFGRLKLIYAADETQRNTDALAEAAFACAEHAAQHKTVIEAESKESCSEALIVIWYRQAAQLCHRQAQLRLALRLLENWQQLSSFKAPEDEGEALKQALEWLEKCQLKEALVPMSRLLIEHWQVLGMKKQTALQTAYKYLRTARNEHQLPGSAGLLARLLHQHAKPLKMKLVEDSEALFRQAIVEEHQLEPQSPSPTLLWLVKQDWPSLQSFVVENATECLHMYEWLLSQVGQSANSEDCTPFVQLQHLLKHFLQLHSHPFFSEAQLLQKTYQLLQENRSERTCMLLAWLLRHGWQHLRHGDQAMSQQQAMLKVYHQYCHCLEGSSRNNAKPETRIDAVEFVVEWKEQQELDGGDRAAAMWARCFRWCQRAVEQSEADSYCRFVMLRFARDHWEQLSGGDGENSEFTDKQSAMSWVHQRMEQFIADTSSSRSVGALERWKRLCYYASWIEDDWQVFLPRLANDREMREAVMMEVGDLYYRAFQVFGKEITLEKLGVLESIPSSERRTLALVFQRFGRFLGENRCLLLKEQHKFITNSSNNNSNGMNNCDQMIAAEYRSQLVAILLCPCKTSIMEAAITVLLNSSHCHDDSCLKKQPQDLLKRAIPILYTYLKNKTNNAEAISKETQQNDLDRWWCCLGTLIWKYWSILGITEDCSILQSQKCFSRISQEALRKSPFVWLNVGLFLEEHGEELCENDPISLADQKLYAFEHLIAYGQEFGSYTWYSRGRREMIAKNSEKFLVIESVFTLAGQCDGCVVDRAVCRMLKKELMRNCEMNQHQELYALHEISQDDFLVIEADRQSLYQRIRSQTFGLQHWILNSESRLIREYSYVILLKLALALQEKKAPRDCVSILYSLVPPTASYWYLEAQLKLFFAMTEDKCQPEQDAATTWKRLKHSVYFLRHLIDVQETIEIYPFSLEKDIERFKAWTRELEENKAKQKQSPPLQKQQQPQPQQQTIDSVAVNTTTNPQEEDMELTEDEKELPMPSPPQKQQDH